MAALQTAAMPEVAELLQRLMEALMHDRPDRPVRYMLDYVLREREGLPHPLPREPAPEPEIAPPPKRIRRTNEIGLPPLRSYYGELMRAKWFSEPEGSKRTAQAEASAALPPKTKQVRRIGWAIAVPIAQAPPRAQANAMLDCQSRRSTSFRARHATQGRSTNPSSSFTGSHGLSRCRYPRLLQMHTKS